MTAFFSSKFAPFIERLEMQGAHPIFIDTFAHYYQQLLEGQTGLIPETAIAPVRKLADAEALPVRLAEIGARALAKTAVIKLNGGLGTSMGLERAKSLLVVKDNLSFLDIIVEQSLHMNVPLLLMNSFATDDDSKTILAGYDLPHLIPTTFLQNKQPKINQHDLLPATWPENPELEWCPPGHGDIYTALVTSGTLATLLAEGYHYAFVSNADNLGAVVDRAILGYFVENEMPFMLEVADRTEMDRKGGHLAQRKEDGQLILRESAQCAPEDDCFFQDVRRHKYFNTNNLWLNLRALQTVLTERNNRLGLPLIRNSKTIDPRDSSSTPVYQLETAMGSAIAVFEGAQALRVPRSRFAPVKKTNDLLMVRSDAYRLTDDFQVIPDPQRPFPELIVELDQTYYKFVNDIDEHFPHGLPSLFACSRLCIQGNIKFGRDVVLRREVALINHTSCLAKIPDSAILEGVYHF